MAHKGMMNLDLGLSDDEDSTPLGRGGRGGGRKESKEESISDLIGSRKDSAMMFGSAPKRRDTSFMLGLGGSGSGSGSVDPLDMLKQAKLGGSGPPQPQEDEEDDLEFQLEMQKQLGLAGLDTSGAAAKPPPAKSRSVSPAPRATTPPAAAPAPSEGSEESLADIVGDILGDEAPKPAKRNTARRSSEPAALSPRRSMALEEENFTRNAAGTARQRGVGSAAASNAGTNDWDEEDDAMPRRSQFREASGGRGESGQDVSPRRPSRAGSRPPLGGDVSPGAASDRFAQGASEMDGGAPDRSGFGRGEPASTVGESFGGADTTIGATSFGGLETESTIGRRGGRRKLAQPSSTGLDDDPLADILGGGGGSAASRPARSPSPSPGEQQSALAGTTALGDTSVAASSLGGAPFEAELIAKPKRRLGKAKAQPSPAPSRVVTPPPVEEDAAGANTTSPIPQRASTPPQTPPAALAEPMPRRAATPPVQETREATPPIQEEPDDESADLDDLLQDNTAPSKPATPPAATPKATTPQAQSAPQAAGESDSELPDFLASRASEPRQRRGAASVRSSATPPPTTPPKAQFDLGFEEDDLGPSDHSASAPDALPSAPGASGSGGGSGSGPLEVPLTAGSGSGRKLGSRAGTSPGGGSAASAARNATPPASASAAPSAQAAARGATPPGSGVAGASRPGDGTASKIPSASPSPGPKQGYAASVASSRGAAAVGIGGLATPVPGLPGGTALHAAQGVAQGLDPGSPLTQTAQSEGGSYRARFHVPGEAAAAPVDHAQVRVTRAAEAAAAALMADAGAGVRSPSRSAGGAGGAPGTPPSEQGLSLFGGDAGVLGAAPPGGFSAFPPLAAAPSQDLLWKLAQSEAKVKHLELQLEDCEQRWQQRFADAKKQEDGSMSRMELQTRTMEAELERSKEMHASELRHLHESKNLLMQSHETEKENARRDERRKAQLDVEKVRADSTREIEELRRKHERAVAILKQQADMEAESLRRAHTGEHQLAKLVEQVQDSVAEVQRMSNRVDTDKTLEWSVRERQIEAREKSVREMEARLSSQSKEVEEQRRRVSELLRNLDESQVDDRNSLSSERERLKAEHTRLQELQQCVREADRNNKEALKHSWAQVEEERRSFQQDQMRVDTELAIRKEEVEIQERQIKQEAERLKALHQQIEVARQNASRRIRETESTVANERRCLMNDLEVFEEKRGRHAQEVAQLEAERKAFVEEKSTFDSEIRSVGLMAQEVERRSEEIKELHAQAAEARGEIQLLRSQLQEERSAQGSEMERLKTMQTLIEQQRLQLLQTENQLRVRGIEDMDLMVTTEAYFPGAQGGEFGELVTQPQPGAFGAPQVPSEPVTAGSWPREQLPPSSKEVAVRDPSQLRRPLATPCRAPAGVMGPGGGRVELQTMLRRTREENGAMHLYIQESASFLRQAEMTSGAGMVPPHLGGVDPTFQTGLSSGVPPGVSPGVRFADYGTGGFPRQVAASPSFGPSSGSSSLDDAGASGTPESLSDLNSHH